MGDQPGGERFENWLRFCILWSRVCKCYDYNVIFDKKKAIGICKRYYNRKW